MIELTEMQKLNLDADTQLLVEEGWLDSSLNLTSEAKTRLVNRQFGSERKAIIKEIRAERKAKAE